MLHEYLSQDGYTLEELNTNLYAIPAKVFGLEPGTKELKGKQGEFFKAVYRLLIDREKGPRLYLFLYAIEKDRYLGLLDFSYPKTEEETAAEAAEAAAAEAAAQPAKEERVYGEPDPVEPVAPEIDIDRFLEMDLRVCKILKAQEIRKSHSCYKLTLDDGLGGRVIVSSIKQEYTPEELVGKKIIVVANLKPQRITGVTSQGMLLAGHQQCLRLQAGVCGRRGALRDPHQVKTPASRGCGNSWKEGYFNELCCKKPRSAARGIPGGQSRL